MKPTFQTLHPGHTMKAFFYMLGLLVAVTGVPQAWAVTVTSLNNDGPGSLRAAVAAGGNIDFAVTGTITLTSGELLITSPATITGPGAGQLTVQRSTAAGTPEFRIFRVTTTATMSGLTISNGIAPAGNNSGGGIRNEGLLALNDCVLSGNRADDRGAGLFNAWGASLIATHCVFAGNTGAADYSEGGGIYVFGEVTVNDSTFSGNSGGGTYSRGGGMHVDYFGTGHVARCTFSGNSVAGANAQGGGIYNYGKLDMVNSTLSGNSSGGTGGGLHVDTLSLGTTVRNCTISGNNAREGSGIYNNGFLPYDAGQITISDSIVAGNLSAAEDVDNDGVINSGGHNLFGIVAGNTITVGTGDQFGLTAAALKLAALANNGGPTQTRRLMAGSPAIDAGNPTSFPATDQRGVARPFGPRSDIGAFELDFVATNLPPPVRIITPTNHQSFTARANISIFASFFAPVFDTNRFPVSVEFFEGTNSLGFGSLEFPVCCCWPCPSYAHLTWFNVPPGNYTLTAVVTASGGAVDVSEPVHITVGSVPPSPSVVTVIATTPHTSEPGPTVDVSPGVFTVYRSGSTNEDLQVFYRLSGTASNGLDYHFLSNSVTIPAGQTSTELLVLGLFDGLVEGTETVVLHLETPACIAIYPPPPGCYEVGTPAEAVVKILDYEHPTNHPPPVRIIAPTNHQSFTAPADIWITARMQDPDGFTTTVEFFEGTRSLGFGVIPPSFCGEPACPMIALLTWLNVVPGDYVLTARATDNDGAVGVSEPVHITVQGVPTLPTVTIHATDPTASEPGILAVVDAGMFTIQRTGPTNFALPVFYRIGGTASNGVDYIALSNQMALIPAGAVSTTIQVVALDDNLAEGNETVVLQLFHPPVGAPIDFYIIGTPSNAVVTIVDNDQTNPPLSVNIIAPPNGASFSAPADILISARTFDLNTHETVAAVEFFAGTNSLGVVTNYIPSLSPLDIRFYHFGWSNVPAGIYSLTVRATETGGATTTSSPVQITVFGGYIPPPTVTIEATDPNASETCALTVIEPGVFTITRSHGTNVPLHVFLAIQGTASNGVDYIHLANSVVIPAGRLSTTIQVVPLNDSLPEGVESVKARILPPACLAVYRPPYDCYEIGATVEATVSIADCPATDVPPTVSIVKPWDGQMFLSPTNVTIVADTVDADGYVWKVEFFADNAKIYEEAVDFFVAPPSGEHIQYLFVWTKPPPGGHILTVRATDDQGTTAVSGPVTIWVVTNLPPPLPIVTITATDPIATEGTNCCGWTGWSNATAVNFCGTNTATFVVRRTDHTNWTLRVFYQIGGTASNGVDYATLPGEVTIPAGRLSAEFKVVPIDDNLRERIETVVISLRAPLLTMNSAAPYIVGFPRRAAAIIVDNDQPRPVTGLLADHCFHFMRPGSNGAWFRIECSEDLIHWSVLCTNMVTDGALHFVDPDADEAPQRFYRAVPETNPPDE